jgi:hypothetical protein
LKRTVLATRRSGLQVFCVPILLGLLSVVGLLSALLGNDIWNAISWLALGLPCALLAWFWFFAGRAFGKTAKARRRRGRR